jgi:hypothetical protein
VYSITIFEAIGFRKPIFILKHDLSDFIPDGIGKKFVKLTIPFTQGNYQAAFLQGFSGLGAFPTISQ